MNKVLVVAAGIALLGLVTGCTTQEGTKTQPAKTAKVQPAKTEAAKTEAAKAQPAKAETPAKKPVKIEYVDTPSGRWRGDDVNRPGPGGVLRPGRA